MKDWTGKQYGVAGLLCGIIVNLAIIGTMLILFVCPPGAAVRPLPVTMSGKSWLSNIVIDPPLNTLHINVFMYAVEKLPVLQ